MRSTVAPNRANVLSAFVTATVRAADSVAVRYSPAAIAADSVTPAFAVTGDSVAVLVLGLEPSTAYAGQLVAFNECATTMSAVIPFTTDALPSDIPRYSTTGSAPTPGYVVFGAGRYGLVIDNTGRVVWYHRFPNGPGLNFQAQPNGRYAARPTPPPGTTSSEWMEIAPDGTIARRLGCARGLQPRMHDMIAAPDGSYWLLCDEVRTLDLSAQGASSATRVLGTAVQRRSATGDIMFEWSPFGHLDVELGVLEAPDRASTPVNWTHGNALDIDADGNLLVSFRNLSEITKVDTGTGTVLWRLGGSRNEFQFSSGEVPAFARQHGVRATGRGQLLLLDNLGHPRATRAERYEIDGVNRTARLSGSYGATAGLVAEVGGTTQALPHGHTLVSFGSGAGVEEYDAAGNVVWKITGDPGYIFRAQRIRSLYRPGVGDPR